MTQVNDSVFLKRDRALTPQAFDKLLAWLDADRERAGQRYEEIRNRLIKFFEWQGCAYLEEQADETIDRVARKIDEGVEVLATNPYIYFAGVARNVLREYWRHPERGAEDLEIVPRADDDGDKDAQLEKLKLEQRLECLEHCLQSLPSDQRELITEYYREEAQAKIRTRKKLAERLGIPLNALRIRSCRIRVNLEKCITECLNPVSEDLK
jgi:DNA-directed RNA polymerase specialized sigma24 family protein